MTATKMTEKKVSPARMFAGEEEMKEQSPEEVTETKTVTGK